MIYSVYAIRSQKDGRVYVGLSDRPDERIADHNKGVVASTQYWRPWKLIYLENCGYNRARARERERYFKSGVGKEFLKNIVGDEDD